MRFKQFPLLLVLALSLAMLPVAPATADEAAPALGADENLGHAIPGAFLSPDSAQGVDESGRLLAFYVSNGNAELPMMLQVVDVEKKEVLFQQRVEAGINCWAVTFSEVERRVYFGSTEGHLYSWKPGEEQVTSLGMPAGHGKGSGGLLLRRTAPSMVAPTPVAS